MFDFYNFLGNCNEIVWEAILAGEELKDSNNYGRIERDLDQDLWYGYQKDINIHFYGSRMYGLASSSSDLDIFVDDKDDSNYYDSYYNDVNKAEFLENIYDSIRMNDDWVINAYLPNLKVPLLRATYMPFDLNCDIIVQNGIGVESSELVAHLFDIQPEAKWFFHFVRLWLEGNGVRMKTYTLTMLVIFFLQTRNFMPSTKRVQKNLEEVYINGVEVQFNPNRTLCSYGTRKLRNYKDFLVDFFDFYGNFDFGTGFISVVDGALYNYYDFSHIADMQRPMSISGIFQNSVNSGKLIGPKRLQKFQCVCGDAAEILNCNEF